MRLGLPTIPVCAETIAISNFILLMKETGVKVHLCRISSAEGLALISDAKQQGLPITCDVTISQEASGTGSSSQSGWTLNRFSPRP